MGKIVIIFGTRPELLKLVPIINEFETRGKRQDIALIHTGQHNSLIEEDLRQFNVLPDFTININRQDDSLSNLVSLLVGSIENRILAIHNKTRVDLIIVQGDTASTYCAALVAYHNQIPLVHIEGGMRTNDIYQPFPEEFYRKSISIVSTLHFVPTHIEKENLLKEGFGEENIYVVGNTIIDLIEKNKPSKKPKEQAIITLHRRHSDPSEASSYFSKIQTLIESNPEWKFIWIEHPNAYHKTESLNSLNNVTVLKPVTYIQMLNLYSNAGLVITDSGGVQEEASAMKIPCLIARKKTERVSGLDFGCSRYLTDVASNSLKEIEESFVFKNGSEGVYGNGTASKSIVDILLNKELSFRR